MKKISLILLLLSCLVTSAQTLITATVTITNTPTTNGQTITMNADVRRWTNSVFLPATQIRTNSTISGSAVNLVNHLALHPFSGLQFGLAGTTGITLRSNAAFTITLSPGWASLTYVTNSLGNGVVVRVPISEEVPAQQTNIASDISFWLNSTANTNPITVLAAHISGAVAQATHATNADLATLASYVSGTLTNPISGNASTATLATNAINATNSFHLLSTFASASNTITLNNGYWIYQTSGPFAVTNTVGQSAGFATWAVLRVSNSIATPVTGYVTAPNVRPIGSATTNAIIVPAGEVAIFSFASFGLFDTNYTDAAQQ